MTYFGTTPAGHADALAAAGDWRKTLADRIDPARAGLAQSALFALFRLSDAERVAVFRVFCKECGDHKEGGCYCWNDD